MSLLGTRGAVGAAALAVAAATHVAPAVAAWSVPRRLFLPGLAGIGRPDHVALTFDDGPDPRSTPVMLDLLARHGVRATFFLVGKNVAANPGLAAEIAAAGHELAVHGLRHRLLLKYPPGRVYRDLAYARALVASAAGVAPRWFRPPFGVLSTGAAVAARRLRMRTVLWSAWGRDWTAAATGDSVFSCVSRELAGGGTVLLHDTASDTAAPDSWRATVDAVPRLLDLCAVRGWSVGPLAEHGLAAPAPTERVPEPARAA